MQKTWTWSTTGYSFVGKTHDEICDTCTYAGLAGVEAALELFPTQSDAELEGIAALYREAGLGFDSFHLPFTAADDISSFYETTRRASVAKATHWMEKASILGARVGIQHPTTTRFDTDVEGLDNYLRQLGKSLETLLPAAERFNFTIALENMTPGESGGRLCARPEHFERIAAEFGHPNLGFCLDTGHALMSAGSCEGAAEYLDAMGSRLAAFHLADNAGDRDSHLAPGHGLVEWGPVFGKAAELGYEFTMCIETAPFAFGPQYSRNAWKQMVTDTDALVDQALPA